MSYNRYERLTIDGKILRMPPIKLARRNTDYYEIYQRNMSRLDTLAYKYYNDATYWWLIMLANQDIADMEYNIPDGSRIRIPYPLKTALEDFNNKIEAYDTLYGLE
jgi:phage tail protein X